MSPAQSSLRYKELDALRGIAALMVLFFHFTLWRPQAVWLFKYGNTGVNLFFIISGFVIFMSLDKARTGGEFIANRVSRLYPPYWVAVTLTCIGRYLMHSYNMADMEGVTLPQYLANLTMFQFYLGFADLDGQYWTLIVEMLFYLLMLMLYQFKLLAHIEAIGSVLTVLIVLMATVLWGPAADATFHWVPLLKFFPHFFAGILFYKVMHEPGAKWRRYLLILFCLLASIVLYKPGWFIFIPFLEYAIMLVIFFLLFVLFVNGRLSFIVSRISLFFGKISYSLYLVHNFFTASFLIPLLVDTLGMDFWLACLGIALPAVLLLASLITYFVEVPFSARMRKKLQAVLSPVPANPRK